MFFDYLKSHRFNKNNKYYSERVDKYLAKMYITENYLHLINVAELLYCGKKIDNIGKFRKYNKIVIKPTNTCRKVILINFTNNTMKIVDVNMEQLYKNIVISTVADRVMINNITRNRKNLSQKHQMTIKSMQNTINILNKKLESIDKKKSTLKLRNIKSVSRIIYNKSRIINICDRWISDSWNKGHPKQELFYKDIDPK